MGTTFYVSAGESSDCDAASSAMFDDVDSNASWSMVADSVGEDGGLVARTERRLVEGARSGSTRSTKRVGNHTRLDYWRRQVNMRIHTCTMYMYI